MELITNDKDSATLKLSNPELALLSSILRVFEHKMDQEQIDYEMLTYREEEAERFLSAFWASYQR